MNATDVSQWTVTGIENAVLVTKENSTDFARVGDRLIKTFGDRRYHGLILGLEGDSRYIVAEKYVLESKPGTLIYLPQGQPYQVESIERGSCYCVNFYIGEDVDTEPFIVIPRNAEKLKANFSEMVRTWLYRHPGYRARLCANLYDLLATIEEDRHARYLPERQITLFRALMSRVEQDLRAPLSVSQLAAECNMCEAYFRRVFHEIYGLSPKQYIREARFRKAKILLANTETHVSVIAESCGFESLYYFSRAFRAREGVSPSEYRQTHSALVSPPL